MENCVSLCAEHIIPQQCQTSLKGYNASKKLLLDINFFNFTFGSDFSNSPYSIQRVMQLGHALQIFSKLDVHWVHIKKQLNSYFNLSTGSMVVTLIKKRGALNSNSEVTKKAI